MPCLLHATTVEAVTEDQSGPSHPPSDASDRWDRPSADRQAMEVTAAGDPAELIRLSVPDCRENRH